MKNVHILPNSHIVSHFIKFLDEKVKNEDTFIYYGYQEKSMLDKKVIELNPKALTHFITLLKQLIHADKIILHGLFDNRMILILFLNPWLLTRCYWVIWGGDLHYDLYRKSNFKNKMIRRLRKSVIKRIGNLVTYVKGDYKLAQKWYGAKGKYHECIMYPSNLYHDYDLKISNNSTINIQVGNSADYTNYHEAVFEKLEKYKERDIKIVVPLAYGEMEYRDKVIKQGTRIFGNKFQALEEFLTFDKYLKVLADIDIVFFNHNRQQAMGNLITLLGLGKKIYIRKDISSWDFLVEKEIKVFSINGEINLTLLDEENQMKNKKIIKEYFSEINLKAQLENIFYA